jgi:hypothetical protein
MKFTLPPQISEKRRLLARSHNNRVMALLMLMFGCIFAGLYIFPRSTALCWLLPVCIGEVAGIIYVIWLSKRQSIALGFVCPLCGGALYDGRNNRLGYRGECPCCKQFIIDRL